MSRPLRYSPLLAGAALALALSGASAQPPPAAPDARLGTPPRAATTTFSETRVTNPATGVALWVGVLLPATSGSPPPVLVLVPGGLSAGSQSFHVGGADASLAAAGFAVVMYDPDGRGNSAGVEDQGGHNHQDGLAAVIRYAALLPGVDTNQIVLAAYSYGITHASGALARNPELPVRALIDWEGPDSRWRTGCRNTRSRLSHPCNDDAYWSEREAVTFISRIPIPYQRIQTARDHVQPNAEHAIALINAATASADGGNGRSPFTRLNDEPANTTYTLATLPPLPEEDSRTWRERAIARYARELLSLTLEAGRPSA